MKIDFDRIHNRRGTASYKWDQSEKLYGNADILPMWVADMDFQAPAEVVQAVSARAEHGIYGYTFRDDDYFRTIAGWQKRRHGWDAAPEWIVGSPGVVTTLSLAVELLTEPGDGVVLQAPVYYPFYDVIEMNGRKVVNNALIAKDGKFRFDLDKLDSQLADDRVKLLLLCNPHNPGGRVWTAEELKQLGELCLKHGVKVVSDEIHGDLVLPGHKHTPFASLSEAFAANSITAIAPSKTFNMPGLQNSTAIIPDPELRARFSQRLKALSVHMESYFGGAAAVAAYTHGDKWLDQLLVYLQANLDALEAYLAEKLPEVRVMRPEGTYLVWVDCRAISEDPEALKKLMHQDAKVAFNDGTIFGSEGRGYLRMNIACPRSTMLEGLRRFTEAARSKLQAT